MAARGLLSPVVVLASVTLAAGSQYFSQYEDMMCTGAGTMGEYNDRTGVMTEFEWKAAPTSSTGCQGDMKCIQKGGGNCDTKYYSVSVTCGTGNSNVTIQTFRGAAADMTNYCKAGNEYYKYEIMSSEFANLRAGSCTNGTFTSSSSSSARSMKLSGFSSSMLCDLCGGTCSGDAGGTSGDSGSTAAQNGSTQNGSTPAPTPVSTASDSQLATAPAFMLILSVIITLMGF